MRSDVQSLMADGPQMKAKLEKFLIWLLVGSLLALFYVIVGRRSTP